jgi:hypothetical protein
MVDAILPMPNTVKKCLRLSFSKPEVFYSTQSNVAYEIPTYGAKPATVIGNPANTPRTPSYFIVLLIALKVPK